MDCAAGHVLQKIGHFPQGGLLMKDKPNVLVTLGWFDPRIIEGVGCFAREAGWHLEMRAVIEGGTPRQWRGDGMLVNDTEVPRLERFIEGQIRRQPTVLIGSNHRHTDLPAVQEDNFEIGGLAAAHFLERGHRSFAWFSLRRGRVEADRRKGFVDVLAAAGHSCSLLERGREGDSWDRNRKALLGQLERLPKPLAVFCLDDLLAIDTVEVCLSRGWRVPEDVAVMGVGNMELACECSRVPISSVDENLAEMAYRAAAKLDVLMRGGAGEGDTAGVLREVVPVKGVFLRRSTDSLAVAHAGLKRALEFIKAESAGPIGTPEIAQAAGLSRRALHYAFQGELKSTPASHLLRVRMEKAEAMLLGEGAKISAVAEACGFGPVRNLHRCFVRERGCSPKEFRARGRSRGVNP